MVTCGGRGGTQALGGACCARAPAPDGQLQLGGRAAASHLRPLVQALHRHGHDVCALQERAAEGLVRAHGYARLHLQAGMQRRRCCSRYA